ncbi:nSTAND1 domain-containing NTPase [Actinacidiphila alni]|uniref:nSTAND1 domain-containing NTPase n=1 Tax=Actinacidiphila alni TaxID=380248 RepID=UPI003452E8BF
MSLPTLLAYVRACGGDEREWEDRWHRAQTAGQPDSDGDDNVVAPYRGLARYEPADKELFFGRDYLIADVVEMVGRRRFSALIGASGAGKSSLLRAGAIPALRDASAPGPRLAAVRVLTPGERPAQTHADRLADMPDSDGDVLVVVDQFEEIFTLCHDPVERDRFVGLLLGALDEGSRLRVVIAVRADFYGRCAEHPALAAALQDANLLVGPMGAAELREAVVRPAAAAGLIVEKSLTARIIGETVQEPGGLPLMSHALLETWRRRRGRALTEAMYEAAGGIHGAVATTAEDLYQQLTPQQRETARQILLRLVTPGDGTHDTRRPVARAELETGSPDTAAVLEHLARARLLTVDDGTVDLAHEALISAWPRLRAWIDNDREQLRLHRSLSEAAAAWAGLDQDPGALLRGSRLDSAAEAFRPGDRGSPAMSAAGDPGAPEPVRLTPLEHRFLTASIALREKEVRTRHRTVRRMRFLTAGLAVLLVPAVLAAVAAVRQRTTADRARARAVAAQQTALSRQLAAQSTSLAATDPDLSALLAVQAYRTQPTREAQTAVYDAAADPLRLQLNGNKPVTGVAFSPDGRTLCWSEQSTAVRCADTMAGTVHALPATTAANKEPSRRAGTGTGSSPNVTGLVFLNDRTLLITDELGGTHTTDIITGRAQQLVPAGATPKFVAISADGRTQTLVNQPDWQTGRPIGDPAITVRDARNGHTRSVVRPPNLPTDAMAVDGDQLHIGSVMLAISTDGQLIATATGGTGHDQSTSLIRVWDTATGGLQATLRPDTAPTTAAFSPTGHELATGEGDHLRIWNLLARTSTSVSDSGLSPTAMAFTPDGSALAAAGDNGAVSLVNMDTHRNQVL